MLDIKLTLSDASNEQQAFAAEAIDRLKAIVNHQPFLDAVLNAQYTRKKLWLDNGNIEEASNEKVLEILTTGKERLTQGNNILDLLVKLARLRKRTVGMVIPPNPLITTNTRFVDRWMASGDPVSLSAQWLHEWFHVAGFLHATDDVDENDLNYTIGSLVVKYGRALAEEKGESIELVSKLGQGYLETVEKGYEQ